VMSTATLGRCFLASLESNAPRQEGRMAEREVRAQRRAAVPRRIAARLVLMDEEMWFVTVSIVS
jgi:hypothetical protein